MYALGVCEAYACVAAVDNLTSYLVQIVSGIWRTFLISVEAQPTGAVNNHQTLMNSSTLFAGLNDLRLINESDLGQSHLQKQLQKGYTTSFPISDSFLCRGKEL